MTHDVEDVLIALAAMPAWMVYGGKPDEFASQTDYDLLLRSIGYPVLLQADESCYQGSTFVLFSGHLGEVGFLSFGWGSCSGCDALQGCESWADIENLRHELVRDIVWKPGVLSMARWLNDGTVQELKWTWTSDAFVKLRGAFMDLPLARDQRGA